LHAEDISSSVFETLAEVNDKKSELVQALESGLPDVEMGDQCHAPFTCEFVSICQKVDQPDYPLSTLPMCGAKQKKTLTNAGYSEYT